MKWCYLIYKRCNGLFIDTHFLNCHSFLDCQFEAKLKQIIKQNQKHIWKKVKTKIVCKIDWIVADLKYCCSLIGVLFGVFGIEGLNELEEGEIFE